MAVKRVASDRKPGVLPSFSYGLALVMVVALFFLLPPSLGPVSGLRANDYFSPLSFAQLPLVKKTGSLHFENVSARSFVVMDYDSGKILVASNPDLPLPPASLTKMMTALVAVESFSPNDWLRVSRRYPVGKTMGLREEAEMQTKDLFLGLLVHSANDAAFVFADNYNQGSPVGFVERMNQKAQEIGLTKTYFVNFDGEEDEGHYSTARDLALLTRVFLENKTLAKIVTTKEAVVYDRSGYPYRLWTTDELLYADQGFRGVKTGWTLSAGECFAGLFIKGDKKLITVVLNSTGRFADTRVLVDQVINNFDWTVF